MLTHLKKFFAAMTVATTILLQIPMAGAFTISGSTTGSGSTNYQPTYMVPGSNVGNVYGTSSSGSTSTATSGSNVLPTNNVPAGQECNVYGCTNGYYGTGNGNPLPTNNVPAGQECNVYGCNGTPGVSACSNRLYPRDIDGHWAEIYIRRLYDLCIVEGYGDGTYRPNQDVSRAELVKMALYAAGIAPNTVCYDADCGSPFNDLDMWQGRWIRSAWDRGIVQGYGDNTFRPNQDMTRAEATKVILSAFGYSQLSTDHSFFKDVSGWSTGWIEQAHELGIVSGIGNGNFDPDRPITRAEAAKIIVKTLEKADTRIN